MPETRPIALLDACSLYPVVLRETLLRVAASGLFRPVWSERVIQEVIRHQTAHGRSTSNEAQDLHGQLTRDFPDAWVHPDDGLIARMTNHPKDRHVLAAAVKAGATHVVTSNLKDFPPPPLHPYGIEAQHPAAFLAGLYRQSPTLMRDVLSRQAAAWEPAITMAILLDWLQTTAPKFARLVTRDLESDDRPIGE